MKILETSVYDTKLYDLLRAYANHVQSKQPAQLRILPTDLYSMDDALRRFSTMLGMMLPDWQTLQAFLPDDIGAHASPIRRRSALAATFAATLELTRSGRVELRQDGVFGPIYLRAPAQQSETP
jgi:segregation and condensation protein A